MRRAPLPDETDTALVRHFRTRRGLFNVLCALALGLAAIAILLPACAAGARHALSGAAETAERPVSP